MVRTPYLDLIALGRVSPGTSKSQFFVWSRARSIEEEPEKMGELLSLVKGQGLQGAEKVRVTVSL